MNYHGVKAFILHKLERELGEHLAYHGVHHTLDVLFVTQELCHLERVSPYERLLLKTAALFHDSGFIIDPVQHEQMSCFLARKHLPDYGYTGQEIERICGMIMATKIPQTPQNNLEQILCDADLDYLGRDDFFAIGQTLYKELCARDVIHDEKAWNCLQVDFLRRHSFFTTTNQQRRAKKKSQRLRELEKLVSTYTN